MKTIKYKILIILIVITSFFSQQAFSQLCANYHKSKACAPRDIRGFQPYGQSKSGMLDINKPFEYKMVLYGERDYIFTICTETGYSPVHFKIMNAQSKAILYDNAEDEYLESVGFSNEYTQSVIVEITILAEKIEPEDAYDSRACIGINVYWRKVPKIGFE